jgi:putative transport protein
MAVARVQVGRVTADKTKVSIMDYIIHTLQKYPEIAIYLTIAVGFWVGNLSLGKFNLGVVTSTLLAGLLIGQVHLVIPPVLQSTFFAMFLFAVGYAVGPQFIRALKSDGISQVFFTILVCASGLVTAILLGKMLHYDAALTAGLLSGGYTNSTVLGVATDLLNQVNQMPGGVKVAMALMPVAYAVTYPSVLPVLPGSWPRLPRKCWVSIWPKSARAMKKKTATATPWAALLTASFPPVPSC